MAKAIKYVALHLMPIVLVPGKAGDKAKGVAPVKPKMQNINPGDRIMLDPEDTETQFYLDAGAIRKARDDDDTKPVQIGTKKKATAKPAASSGDGGKTSEPKPTAKEPKDMTVAELKAALDEKEIEYDKDAKKADLIALLEGDGDENLV
jgi:hypothetical protein